VAAGFSPLDEALGLLPGALTPPLQRHLSRLGTRLGFAEAAAELAALRRVTVSVATARRRTEADGAILVGLEDEEATRLAQACPAPPVGPPVQQVSVDGVLAPLVGGDWGEVKLVAIGTVGAGAEVGTVTTTDLSYFGRRTDAATFAELMRGEVQRRGVETAGVVAGVSDGAPWCQGVLDRHRPDAVRILDFPHACQRLSEVAVAVWGEGDQATTWAAAQRAELRDGAPDRVLAALRALPAVVVGDAADAAGEAAPVPGGELPPAAAAVRDETLGYLASRREQIDYAGFRDRGLPIGSGAVESACKVMVEARLKGAGRRWAPANINPMVALRGVLCSGRWEERWPDIARARRAQARTRTHQRRLARRPAVPAPAVAAPRRPRLTQPAIGTLPPSNRPKLVIDGRPTTRHPWKQSHRPPHPTPTAAPAKL
jgi:hypothetical protein